MKSHPPFVAKSVVRQRLAGAIIGLTALSTVWAGVAQADPSQDSVANLKELSHQAEQLADSIQAAKADLDRKLALLGEADRRHSEDLAALEAAKARMAAHQGAIDRFAATVYMGGRADDVTAILTASSPKSLMDKLGVQRAVITDMSAEMAGLRGATEQAQSIEAASAKSAADAKGAMDAAVAVRTDLLAKQKQLKSKIDAAAAQAVLSAPPAAVMAALGQVAPMPTVGMGGLVPNARKLVYYIMTTFPGVHSIGGVRSDPLPDHPSGHAIDIMTDSDMALGDAIHADIQSKAAEFGVSYTLWRVANHFNHIHVTVH